MAHKLEITADGTTSFAYSLQHGSPWHRLGTPLDGLSTLDDILLHSRADYEVHKAVLMTPNPMAPEGPMLDTGQHFTWRTQPIWIDQETGLPQGGEQHVLGVVGSKYSVFQNRAVAEFGLNLAGALPGDPGVDCAGVLDNGRRFFMTIPLPDVVLDPEGAADLHVRNLVVTTGHDGNWSLQMVNSTVRAVCANTVAAALKQNRWAVTIRHTGDMDITEGTVRQALGLTEKAGDEFRLLGEQLMAQGATFDLVRDVHDQLWGNEASADTMTRRINRAYRLATLESLWTGPTNTGAVGGNRWAALNTFSEYFQHRASFAGSKKPGARDLRATEGKALNNRVHEVSRILQTI